MKVALMVANRTDTQEGVWSDDERTTYGEFLLIYLRWPCYGMTLMPWTARFVKSGVCRSSTVWAKKGVASLGRPPDQTSFAMSGRTNGFPPVQGENIDA